MRKLKHHEIRRPSLLELADLPRHPIHTLVDDVRSVYNVGSIFRTSDAACIEQLILTGITGTPAHRRLRKTALGAEDTVPWSYHTDPLPPIAKMKAAGYTIAVLEITDSPSYTDEIQATHFPVCLIVGNEVSGVRDALIEVADLALELPQYGAKQSMNVAVAYGVAVYDLVRRYRLLHGLDRPSAAPHPFSTPRSFGNEKL